MSVMGFQKKQFGWGVCGWGELYAVLFRIFLSPLQHSTIELLLLSSGLRRDHDRSIFIEDHCKLGCITWYTRVWFACVLTRPTNTNNYNNRLFQT